MLDGLPVLDLTDHRGEFGPWLLAELGAEVIRVQPSGSEAGTTQVVYNTGKTIVELDPSSAGDRTVLRSLLGDAAIVIDAGPPGRLAAFGVDRTKLLELNPRVVSVLVTAFGSDGPRVEEPFSELTIAALGGPVRIQGTPERAPVRCSVPQVWRHAGAESAVAALVGLALADRSGEAQFIDLSAQAAMTWTMLNAMEAHAVQGFDFERMGATLRLAMTVPLRQKCADGHVIAVPRGPNCGALVPWMIADGLVDESWADQDWEGFDGRIVDGEPTDISHAEVIEAIGALCAGYTKQELMERGMELGVTIAPVNDVVDLLAFDHLESRGYWRELEGLDEPPTPPGPRIPGAFYTLDGERPPVSRTVSRPAPGPMSFTPVDRRRGPRPADRVGQLPFEGLTVADFSWIGVGPITAKCLADHGATVIRVESANRIDGLRMQPPFKDAEPGINRSNFYGSFNTSKQSLALDLKNEGGIRVARRLVEEVDVVIDSFTPGSMDRLGLGPSDIQALNPRAITVTTSLLGGGGPLSTMAGYGYHAAAIAGFFDLVGWADLPPDGPYLAYTDTVAPRFITAALLAAIDRRARTGEGCHIEAAQLECALHFLAPELLDHQLTGAVASRNGNRSPELAPQGIYPCAGDDAWVAISVVDDEAWQRFRTALGNPGWAMGAVLDFFSGRLANHDAIDTGIAAWTSERTEDEVEAILFEAGVAAARPQRSRELVVDPQYQHRRFYRWLDHSEVGSVPYAGHQYRIQGYDNGPRSAAPLLGEQTFEILTDLLGYDIDEVAEIAATGCLE